MGPITARIAAQSEDTANRLHLLARVEVQPNELLEFYEPSPGSILVSGAGAPASGRLFTSDSGGSVEALWKKAARGAAMPRGLTDALARAGKTAGSSLAEPTAAPIDLSTNLAPPPPSAVPERVEAVGYCDSPEFRNSGDALCPWRNSFGYMCKDNWMDGISSQSTGARAMRSQVCPATGSVSLRLVALDSRGLSNGQWIQPVPANTFRAFTWNNIPTANKYLNSFVEDAIGVRFEYIFAVWYNGNTNVWSP
jgi:hypothetical protein